MTKEYNDYLAHHGVKGMRWGIRKDKENRIPRKVKAESSTWKSNEAGSLSDEELNRRNSRLQRENQYRQLTESKFSKAMKWIGRTASTILVVSAVGAAKGKMAGTYKKGLDTIIAKSGPKVVSALKNAPRSALRKVASISAAAMLRRG